jgi:hypothetical protein
MMQGRNVPSRIFLSYSSTDGAQFSAGLRSKLEAQGFSLWQDLTDVDPGGNWWLQIAELIPTLEYLILVVTPKGLQSEVVAHEWRLARQEGVCVIPIAGPGLDMNTVRAGYLIEKISVICPSLTLGVPCCVFSKEPRPQKRPHYYGTLFN